MEPPGVGVVEPLPQTNPAAHGAVTFPSTQYEAGGQVAHEAEEFNPLAAPNVPAGQACGCALPWGQKKPTGHSSPKAVFPEHNKLAGQGSQDAWPVSGCCVPGAQPRGYVSPARQ